VTGSSEVPAAVELARARSIRLELVERHPFWGHLLLGMRLIAAPELPTFAATDCVHRIWLNPRHTRHLDRSQLGFVLLHELGHVVLHSGIRRGRRRLHRWNVATDLAINRMVAAIRSPERPGEPLWLPPDGVYEELGEVEVLLDPRFDDRIAEAIYEMLDDELPGLPTPVDVALPGHYGPATLPGVLDHGGGVDVHLPDLRGGDGAAEARDRVDQARQSWEACDRRGHLPGEALNSFGGADGRPTVPWERLLADAVEAAVGRDDYDLRRPDPRRAELGVIAPQLVGRDPGPVVVALDTSASMGGGLLRQLAVELEPLQDRVERLTLIVADAAVQGVFEQPDLRRLLGERSLPGGGGTDHRPVFEWLAGRPRPGLFVGLTDLWSRFPPGPPDCPVVWVTPARHGKAPWGRVIEAR
jgi:predicted metal-dependent peptidase